MEIFDKKGGLEKMGPVPNFNYYFLLNGVEIFGNNGAWHQFMGPGTNFNRASLSRKSSLSLFLLVFLFFLVKIFVKFE